MKDSIIGDLVDSGNSPTEIREAMGEYAAALDEETDLGSHIQDPSGREAALHTILTKARDDRQPPGPQAAVQAVADVPPSAPATAKVPAAKLKKAKVVRVDTEQSYREFRRSGQGGQSDLPADSVEALSSAAEDELLGGFADRGYASQMLGLTEDGFDRGFASQMIGHRGKYGKHGVVLGNVMDHNPASQVSLHDNPNVSADQSCVICGKAGGSAICGGCHSRLPEVLGLFDRGYASQMLGFGDRGAAASLYDDAPSATMDTSELSTILGPADAAEFTRMERGEGWSEGESPNMGKSSALLGAAGDGFARMPRHDDYDGGTPLLGFGGADGEMYRLPRHSVEAGGLSALIGDVMALSVPSTVYAEEIPLSFKNPNQKQNITTWKQGDSIYGSIRVTGWDGKPRILTTVVGYKKHVGIVVGYATSANIAPTHTIAVLDPLARQLGASSLLPKLAAAAPAVLRVSHGKAAPILLTVMPAGADVDETWV